MDIMREINEAAENDSQLPYDGDQSDERQYCIHGTFTGSWWGPDYICGYCEDGVTAAEWALIVKAREELRIRDNARHLAFDSIYDGICRTFREQMRANPAGVAPWLVGILDDIKTTPIDDLRVFVSWKVDV